MNIERYAGIDIGSNGVRLLIMNIFKVKDKIVFNKTVLVRAPIRLGADSFAKNEIQEDSKIMLNEAMKSFYSLMKCYQVKNYVACATSALREASNGSEVIEYIAKNSGINIKIIDGKEEADIIYQTQISELLEDQKGYLFIDVGGGSTEITYFENKKAIATRSFKIGTVRCLNNLVQPSEWIHLENFIASIKLDKTTIAVGTGGNINTLFKKSQKSIGAPLEIKYMTKMKDELASMTIDERIIKYNFNPDRADVIVPAIEIYCKIMNLAAIKDILVPKIGLADGLIRNLYAQDNK